MGSAALVNAFDQTMQKSNIKLAELKGYARFEWLLDETRAVTLKTQRDKLRKALEQDIADSKGKMLISTSDHKMARRQTQRPRRRR